MAEGLAVSTATTSTPHHSTTAPSITETGTSMTATSSDPSVNTTNLSHKKINFNKNYMEFLNGFIAAVRKTDADGEHFLQRSKQQALALRKHESIQYYSCFAMKFIGALTAYTIFNFVFSLSLPARADGYKSPDMKTYYICGKEKNSAMGCYTHWVKSHSPDLKSDNNKDQVKWLPASCSSTKDKGGLCYQGGVAWWYWSAGEIGDSELQDFVHRDYASPKNETNLGTATRSTKGGFCYVARERTFCMIPMKKK